LRGHRHALSLRPGQRNPEVIEAVREEEDRHAPPIVGPDGPNHRKKLTRSLEDALRRLSTDYLDVFWVDFRDRHTMAEPYGMSVAAWAPLAYGVLSGRFTRPGGPPAGSRVAPESLSERDWATARAVQEAADALGVIPSQVAIAWTRARSRAVHPILRAQSVEQLEEHLAAADVILPEEWVVKLEAATEFAVGYPGDFIAKASL
jgi:aryl-alcohol dehydrogenase-like predicted oxidoreductase